MKENTLEIPIIQRDYAQGRLGKENLRKNFLADLKNALDSGGAMKLDFVYGSIENGNLIFRDHSINTIPTMVRARNFRGTYFNSVQKINNPKNKAVRNHKAPVS